MARVRPMLLAAALAVLVLASSTLTHHTATAATQPGVTEATRPTATETHHCGTDTIQVPDRGAYFDFADACANHDVCYATGGSEFDRYLCDRAFLSDMTASCNAMWPVSSIWDTAQLRSRRLCYGVAYTYYLGVRLGGSAYFNYIPI